MEPPRVHGFENSNAGLQPEPGAARTHPLSPCGSAAKRVDLGLDRESGSTRDDPLWFSESWLEVLDHIPDHFEKPSCYRQVIAPFEGVAPRMAQSDSERE
jgi:hypothetical protein